MRPGSLPTIGDLAAMDLDSALAAIETSSDGLATDEAARRLSVFGPNAVRSHRVQPLLILAHQFANPIQVLLLVAARFTSRRASGTARRSR